MAIYELNSDHIVKINETTFEEVGLHERKDLQKLLKNKIEVIAPDTLVISEEFGEWEDSRRRIDLLGLDKDANLVVIELKRTEDGGHMELQAIRYAAMVSTMTFDKAVEVYRDHLKKIGSDEDARISLLNFLEWDEPDEEVFAQDIRILLVSADFGKELTTSVMWLNDRDLDIRCVRIKPYDDNGRILVDVQQIIPLPEAAEYQVQIREKQQREKGARKSSRDYTRFDVTIDSQTFQSQPKRWAMYLIVKHLCSLGITPEQIKQAAQVKYSNFFRSIEGQLKSEEFVNQLKSLQDSGGRAFDPNRYFCSDEELILSKGNTYALTNQWGKRTAGMIQNIINAFPETSIICISSES